MDDSLAARVIASIFGTSQPQVTPAPTLSSYPSVDDAKFAQESGFGYGTRADPFIQEKQAKVIGNPVYDRESRRWSFNPQSAEGMTATQATGLVDAGSATTAPDATEKLRRMLMGYYGRAALAANRNSIASLGFDPTRAAVDVEMEKPTVGGAYSPSKDAMYAVASDPSAIVHESIHRGLNKLRESNPELAKEIRKIPEETIVRFLMARVMGDPEKYGGSIDKQQREDALRSIDNSITGQDKIIKNLEGSASRMMAKQHPMGPR